MEQEIKDLINKNLPAQVGKVLQERLAKADADEAALKLAGEKITSEINMNLALSRQLEEYKKLDIRNANLDTREATVAEQERNQKVFAAELRAAAAEARANEMAGFVGMVFKSPVFRKTTDQPVYSTTAPNGNWNQTGGGQKTEISIQE